MKNKNDFRKFRYTLLLSLASMLVFAGCKGGNGTSVENKDSQDIALVEDSVSELQEESMIEEDEEKLLYKHRFYEDFFSDEPYVETFLYDNEGNYTSCEYSRGGEKIEEGDFILNLGFEPSFCGFRYGGMEDCNLGILRSVGVDTFVYNHETGQYTKCLEYSGYTPETVHVVVNDNKQISDIRLDNFEIDELVWDGTENVDFKYHFYSYGGSESEKRFENNHLVYHKRHQDSGLTAVGYIEDATEVREYIYDDNDNLIFQKHTDETGKAELFYYIYNSDGDIVACLRYDDDSKKYDGITLFWHIREYDEDDNLIKHEVRTISDVSDSDWELIADKTVDELQEICSQLSENYKEEYNEDGFDQSYVESWEYKTLSEILSER